VKKEFSKQMGFGARLAEERKRLGLKQAEFASLVGTDVPKQSLYENDRRELRADYLARLADAQVDVVFVLTGHRMEGDWLGEGASELLSAYFALPPNLQDVLLRFVSGLRAHLGGAAGHTVHSRTSSYRAREPE
jgi:transcriptional regulator with XRE-family HTH domain